MTYHNTSLIAPLSCSLQTACPSYLYFSKDLTKLKQ
jgi:hypothetical protein